MADNQDLESTTFQVFRPVHVAILAGPIITSWYTSCMQHYEKQSYRMFTEKRALVTMQLF